ncbi:MAG TPA: hypothetical protein DCQ26_15655 [Marinilabiliales bacterium]|nr:MAG: hypothetical protein A2W96_15075 [Bacteroidetes bacterium GWD2_40_43]OFX91657.1 MAG: hypothetical protein A2W97_09135 [Bacteroidetes bacterium GWE2_40_63]OFY23744.1 MAG: hypothetical protein A2W88_10630 [Bacteroidetes bacterium GWF2_40_13]OFZ25994.1 MAG: hypothetical protein A2437_05560 [Bacteroidetes bacterium RIFOXYC2_FULL_40_12]HAN00035.1 hypothetical protein [Marinilabiliales bacterium]
MQKVKLTGVVIILAMMSVGCNNNGHEQLKTESKMKQKETKSLLPTADQFVSSPLRNRVKLELNASVDKVWKVIGRFEHMPEYSIGLHKVDAKYVNSGNCTEYTCYFFRKK